MVEYVVPEKKVELRVYVPVSLDKLFRQVIEKRGESEDYRWTLSDGAAQALSDWLSKPENQEIINEYGLDK